MKKVMGLFISCLLLSGCGNSKYEKLMLDCVKDYYNNHINPGSVDIVKVTISDLKLGVTNGDTYDLTELSQCEDSSYINIIHKQGTTEIQEYEYHLKCK